MVPLAETSAKIIINPVKVDCQYLSLILVLFGMWKQESSCYFAMVSLPQNFCNDAHNFIVGMVHAIM